MSDHRIGTVVGSGITDLIPRINSGLTEIDASCLHKERRHYGSAAVARATFILRLPAVGAGCGSSVLRHETSPLHAHAHGPQPAMA